jgi:DNA-binding FadR family transcriptional regulator
VVITMVRSASGSVFRPVRTRNAFEETVERLLQAIRLGVVGPGERLPSERELSARLGVSRVTLREAIRAVAEVGYVESRRGRYGGTFVVDALPDTPAPDPSDVDLEDVLTLRRVLETGAAETAALRTLTPADRQHLMVALTDVDAVGAASADEYRRRDSRLHLAIAEVSAAPSLVTAVADVRTRVNELLDAIPLLGTNIEHSNVQHRTIVAAILAGDAAAARSAMAEHLAGTAALLHAFL